MDDLLGKADDFLQRAMRAGASCADVLAAHSTDVNGSIRKGKPETLERSESTGLGLRVFIGHKGGYSYATVSSSNLSADNLQQLAEAAVAMARAAPIDPFASLADAARLCAHPANLDLADDAEPSLEQLQQQCRETEEAGLSHAGITNSEGADAGYSRHHMALITSHGFAGEVKSTIASLSLSLIAGEGAAMQRDYAYATTRHLRDLKSPEAIGNEAAARTLAKLNPTKIESLKCPIVFDPRVARSLLSSFASAINGASIARGTSFLAQAMGTALFDSSITIIDDALRPRALGSRPFDGEGVAPTPRKLIDAGVLTSWLLDTRSAAQLSLTTPNLVTTGHASRSLGSAPSPSPTNLWMEAGSITPAALMEDITEGIYITEAFGMGVNLITGDYSQGASGFMIRSGERAEPVSEITIAGHLREMFAHLTAANDLVFDYSINAPTLRVDGMTVAGA